MRVCLNRQTDGVKERPHRIASEGKENWRVLTFGRVEAAEGDATDGLRGYVGLALRFDDDRKELTVEDVLEGSPANKAGLEDRDVVLKIGEAMPGRLSSAAEAIRRAKPGSILALLVRRDGKEREVQVKVGYVPFAMIAQID